MDALVSLIAEALGRFLPDRSAIASAREPLEKFLQSDRCHFLAVTVRGLKEGSPKVTVTTEPGPAQGCDLQLVLTAFNKQNGVLSDLGPSSVGVSFSSPSPKVAAYAQSSYASRRDPSFPMDKTLQTAVETEMFGQGARFYGAITSLEEELKYWSSQRRDDVTRFVLQANGLLQGVKTKPLEDESAVDAVRSLFDSLKPLISLPDNVFSPTDGTHIVSLISAELVAHIRAKLREHPIWRSRNVHVQLNAAAMVLSSWDQVISDVGLKGCKASEPVLHFMERIREIQEILGSYEEISALVAAEGSQAIPREEAFSMFKEPLDVLDTSERASALFVAAQEAFRATLTRHAVALRKLLNTVFIAQMKQVSALGPAAAASSQPLHIFKNMLKVRQVLRQAEIAQECRSEMESLAVEIGRYLDYLEEEFGRREGNVDANRNPNPNDGGFSGSNTSVKVDTVAWCMQCDTKLIRARDALSCLTLGVEQRASTLLERCKRLREKVRAFREQVVELWRDETGTRLQTFTPDQRARVYAFNEKDGHVMTGFSDQLVELLRDVRQMQSLGVKVEMSKRALDEESRRRREDPQYKRRNLQEEIRNIERFYRYGMQLKQIANFYNHLADPKSNQIIACQKPMLISEAAKLESLIRSPTDSSGQALTWDKPQAMKGYLGRLQERMDELVEKNRKLRIWHVAIQEKINQLINTDLVTAKDRWAAAIKEIRDIFKGREKEGFPEESQRAWRLHWDHQLYKALSWQFTRGLEVLYESLPKRDVRAEFKEGRLQLDPPVESLRRDLYESIKGFSALPLIMKGASTASEKQAGFFRGVFLDNAKAVAELYGQAEDLLVRLEREVSSRRDWVALAACDDLDAVVEATCVEVADWDLNFKALRAAAADLDKMVPAIVEVDCFKLSFGPLKDAVMKSIKRTREALVASLTARARGEKEEIAAYLEQGQRLFETSAVSLEQIGDNKKKAEGLVQGMKRMLDLRKAIAEKNKLIAQVADDGPKASVDISDLMTEWDSHFTKLQQYEVNLEEQKKGLETQVLKQVEEFKDKVRSFAARWAQKKPKTGSDASNIGEPTAMLSMLEEQAVKLAELKEEAGRVEKDCLDIGLHKPSFDELHEVTADLEDTKGAWDRLKSFKSDLEETTNKEWILTRNELFKLEDFLTKWRKQTTGRNAVDLAVLVEVDRYQKVLPYLKHVRGEGWEAKHWSQLYQLLGMPAKGPLFVEPSNLTLANFLKYAEALIQKHEEVRQLDSLAQAEASLRKAVNELDQWGYERNFSTYTYESAIQEGGKPRTVPLIREWKEVLTEVGDYQALVGSLKQSPYYHTVKDAAQGWEQRLQVLSTALVDLNAVQRKWLYLEPIFGRGALPNEQGRFLQVDREFVRLLAEIHRLQTVKNFAEMRDVGARIKSMLEKLEMCQKALLAFLEEKRSLFPRFYFLGDDDLLEILGQAKNPEIILRHLKKLFAGIFSVTFTDDKRHITNMCSSDSEKVPLTKSVEISDQVETWLQQLSEGMVSTLRTALQGSLAAEGARIKMDFTADDYSKLPSQVLCLAEYVRFTARAEAAIQEGRLAALRQELAAKLQAYTKMDYDGLPIMQLKMKSLILDLIHYIDIVEDCEADKVSAITDWTWTKQIRYYAVDGGRSCRVMMADADLPYTFEYQGNAAKLVYTPLTDKCFLVLFAAIRLGYGGNPYGPAGTGKTESVKALGQYLARQVLVFNCDEEFDYHSMGRIFMGLVKCGAWGCFDEFNRLEEEVLSAVSMQIQIIQGALKENRKTVFFLEREVEVNAAAGIFVTLNPAGKGYGGRSRLPDNLKQLFRPIAMTVPDNELIAEVLMLSEGFTLAKSLGRKVVKLFEISRQLLSRQQHYDWGLRALKTILGIVGRLLREARAADGGATPVATLEAKVIVQAIRVTTLPKLTFEDTSRFLGLMADEFQGVDVKDVSDVEVEAAVRAILQDWKLQELEHQVTKVMQLHVASLQRIGVIIVGPSGSGKSTLWRVLHEAYRRVGKPVTNHVMNPKAMDRKQLLGSMDLDTREWTDGVLTSAARRVVEEPPHQRSWIICDGDVDPEWIESLNSVLDDNKLLTLPSGERIQFGNNVNFMFECHTLRFASPATVSRCSMIFLSEEDVDVANLIKTWAAKLEVKENAGITADQLRSLALEYIEKAFQLAYEMPTVVPTTKVGLLDSVFAHVGHATSKRTFFEGIVRALTANVEGESRTRLMSDLARLLGDPSLVSALTADTSGKLHASDDIFSGYDELEGGGGGGGASSLANGGDDSYLGSDMRPRLVQTGTYAQTIATIFPWLKAAEPTLVVGPSGCGKSVLLEHLFPHLAPSVAVATVHCTSQTTAKDVISKLRQACGNPVSVSTGRVLRPKEADRLVLFLKDVNLPKPDKYGTMQVVSLLQQLISYGGYYDERENLEFIGLERIQIVCSMNPPTAPGRQALSARFTAVTRVAYLPYPSNEELASIFSKITRSAFTVAVRKNPASAALARSVQEDKLAAFMVDLYGQVKRQFQYSHHRHYLFSPRHLTEWVLGITDYDFATCEVVEALANEALRIFADRLVGTESKEQFEQMLMAALRSTLRQEVPRTFAQRKFSSVAGGPGEDGLSRLSGITLDQYREVVQEGLRGFEREIRNLGLKLFPGCLDLIARLERVLRTPGGSLLLVGPPGAGRRSCCSLAAHMLRMKLVTPSMAKGYGPRQFATELKNIMITSGVEGTPVLFYLEDFQVTHRSFLEAISSLLTGGEVPGLFTTEELDGLLQPLEQQRADLGFQYATNFDFFVSRIRSNLRIAIAMDPEFAATCEDNPALFTRTSVQWVEGWGPEGARQVVQERLKDQLQELGAAHATNKGAFRPDDLIEGLFAVHSSMPRASPRDLSVLVDTYRSVFTAKHTDLATQMKHLGAGVDKLKEAASTVDVLSRKAEAQRKLLTSKQAEADEALEQISVAMDNASKRKNECEKLSSQLAESQGKIDQDKAEAELELAEVQPLIDQARAAVGSIKNEHLSEIKSLKVPPDPIRDVLEGVLKLMGQSDTSWNSMRTFLSKGSVKDQIINFDAHRVTPDVRQDVENLLAKRGNSFEHDVINRVSKAASPLAAWVKANVKFSVVLQKIAPLEAKLASLTESQGVAKSRLDENERELAVLEKKTGELKAVFGRKTGEAESLKAELNKAEETLSAATSLLDKLSGERGRWETQLTTFKESIHRLPVSSLMAAACLTFLPPLPEDQRRYYTQLWQNQIGSNWMSTLPGGVFDLRQFMSTESEVLIWKSEGLAGDDVSVENAISILHNPHRAPLVIDPSQQAAAWLQAHMGKAERPVKVTALHDQRFTNTLELAVRFGESLIIKEVDAIEPLLLPLLRRDLIKNGPRGTVQIGDKSVDYDANFRVYLVTRSTQCVVPPAAQPLLTRANFTVTRAGLEAQLLALTMQKEKPELEAKKSELLRQGESLKIKLADLEKRLLDTLAESKGNLLENRELISSLEETKKNAAVIHSSLDDALKTQEDLDRQRNVYRPVAQRGSALYFLVRDAFTLNPMYRFSLSSFLKLFEKTLTDPAGAGTAGTAETRLAFLKTCLMEHLVEYVSRALFNKDRLVLGMHMAHGLAVDRMSGAPSSRPGTRENEGASAASGAGVGFGVSDKEWDALLGKLIVPGAGGAKPAWVRDDCAKTFDTLVRGFPELAQVCGFAGAGETWAQWAHAARPEAEFPDQIGRRLSPFQQLLVVQALRPDRLTSAMSLYACRTLNVPSLAPSALDLKRLAMHEASPTEPLLLLITPGADPSQELRDFARTTIGEENFHEVAMGQGQAEIALRLLRECSSKGKWLCLKNLHLVTSWLPQLEQAIFGLQGSHENFRLFLTTEPHPKFPDSLLEHCVKTTYEPPPGIRKNLERTFASWGEAYFEQGKSATRCKLLFTLAWVYAVLQERRQYIPQGWCKFYEFGSSDLRSGADIIDISTERGRTPQFVYLHGLLETAIFGGKVDNPYDTLVLRAYLEHFFSRSITGIGADGREMRKLPGTNIIVPSNAIFCDYVNVIQELPEVDSPALFSLPANVNRTMEQNTSQMALIALRGMASTLEAEAGVDIAAWATKLAPVFKIFDVALGGLNASARTALQRQASGILADASAAAGKARGAASASPIQAMMATEKTFTVRLLNTIQEALHGLQRVIKGSDTLGAQMAKLGAGLLADQTPPQWDGTWEGPDGAMDYLRAVAARSSGVQKWDELAQSNRLAGPSGSGAAVDLGELFNPSSFLSALKQETARELKTSMDSLVLVSCWDVGKLQGAPRIVTVGNLFISGAAFDGRFLSDAATDAAAFLSIPPAYIAWVSKDQLHPYGGAFMEVPLYVDRLRSKVLTAMQLPLGEVEAEKRKWALASLALFLSS